MRFAICVERVSGILRLEKSLVDAYLPEAFGLGVFLEGECWEVHATPEDLRFG